MGGQLVRKIWEYDPTLYAPARYRRACSYETFLPDPLAALEVSLSGEVAGIISEAERAIFVLNQGAGVPLGPLARLLLRTESIASSKVEGMQVDARSLARAEANLDIGRRVGPEALEILANIDAMELAIERTANERVIEVSNIEAIHRSLMARDVHVATAGHLRNVQNWIGGNDYNPCGADFVPPPPGELPALLSDLCDFCNDDTLSPLVQAAIAHAQFETVHPFEDGNGRTSRALVQVILRRRGLAPAYVPPISVMLARHKERYIEGLTLFRRERVSDWVRVFAEAAAAAAQLASHYAGRVIELQRSWRERLAQQVNPRSDAAAWPIIDALPAHPIITTSVAATATGRTRPAVANAIEQLESCGVLLPMTRSGRNRAWEADGLLDLIVGLESGQ
ncbi:MAG TPA: Fic family protein [Tepidiformaceae bacterium]